MARETCLATSMVWIPALRRVSLRPLFGGALPEAFAGSCGCCLGLGCRTAGPVLVVAFCNVFLFLGGVAEDPLLVLPPGGPPVLVTCVGEAGGTTTARKSLRTRCRAAVAVVCVLASGRPATKRPPPPSPQPPPTALAAARPAGKNQAAEAGAPETNGPESFPLLFSTRVDYDIGGTTLVTSLSRYAPALWSPSLGAHGAKSLSVAAE
jgi:hypothetical protein